MSGPCEICVGSTYVDLYRDSFNHRILGDVSEWTNYVGTTFHLDTATSVADLDSLLKSGPVDGV